MKDFPSKQVIVPFVYFNMSFLFSFVIPAVLARGKTVLALKAKELSTRIFLTSLPLSAILLVVLKEFFFLFYAFRSSSHQAKLFY